MTAQITPTAKATPFANILKRIAFFQARRRDTLRDYHKAFFFVRELNKIMTNYIVRLTKNESISSDLLIQASEKILERREPTLIFSQKIVHARNANLYRHAVNLGGVTSNATTGLRVEIVYPETEDKRLSTKLKEVTYKFADTRILSPEKQAIVLRFYIRARQMHNTGLFTD